MKALVNWTMESFSEWRFAAFALALLLFFELLLSVLLVVPSGDSGLGLFAREFKTWCFNYDPATSTMDWFYVAVMLTQPLLMGAMIGYIWFKPLRDAWHEHRNSVALVSGFALITVLLITGVFALLGPTEGDTSQYPFPAERLRTTLVPPAFSLVNQDGEVVTLDALRGKVVILTGVYATCFGSCPLIMTKLKEATAQLAPEARDKLAIVAITLDPEGDDRLRLESMAQRHGVGAPLYNFVGGEPAVVNSVLDKLSISRIPNKETGEIDHSNLYVLIDAEGRIAYRLSLNERTSEWLDTALSVLLAEISPPTAVALTR
ncbi:MAG: SCO family protein [Bradymonadaceae bacterium]|nr:SCO family protein [Lujinxingiaceae bacterium]